MKTQPNESAFPEITTDKDRDNPMMPGDTYSYGGMTKREYMATHILSGLAAHPDVANTLTNGGRSIERYAILMADALIEELNK